MRCPGLSLAGAPVRLKSLQASRTRSTGSPASAAAPAAPPRTSTTPATATARCSTRARSCDGGLRATSVAPAKTTSAVTSAASRTGPATPPSWEISPGSRAAALAAPRTCGVVTPIAIAGASSVRNIRTRPGTTAKSTARTTAVATSEPRLSLSSDVPASTTTAPAAGPRSHGGTSRQAASASAGQSAMSQIAALAFV